MSTAVASKKSSKNGSAPVAVEAAPNTNGAAKLLGLTVVKGWHPDTYSIVANGNVRYPVLSCKKEKMHLLMAAMQDADFRAEILKAIATGNPLGLVGEQPKA